MPSRWRPSASPTALAIRAPRIVLYLSFNRTYLDIRATCRLPATNSCNVFVFLCLPGNRHFFEHGKHRFRNLMAGLVPPPECEILVLPLPIRFLGGQRFVLRANDLPHPTDRFRRVHTPSGPDYDIRTARTLSNVAPGKTTFSRGLMALDISGHIAMISLWTGGDQAGSRGPQGRTKAQPKGLTFALQSTNRFVQSMGGWRPHQL